eukprot:COSAG03_NODE_2266_length_2936_cov_7.335213_5_plen_61_part_00
MRTTLLLIASHPQTPSPVRCLALMVLINSNHLMVYFRSTGADSGLSRRFTPSSSPTSASA